MALVLLGGGIADMRGSIGGTTFARSAAGNYARARMKPVNPRTTLQNTRRAEVAYLAKYWSDQLTEQQRTDWRAYATATNWQNKLGQSIQINGLAAFMRLNVLERMTPSAVIAAAPTAMGQGGGVTFTFAAENDTTKLQINEPGGSFDMDVDIMTLWLSCGLPQEVGRTTPPKGFRYVGRIWGSTGAPLVFPYEMDAPYTMAVGQRITCKVMFHDQHYRVSGPFFAQAIAAPS